jgi:transcriptional regulator with XRE-family HTH domain
MSEEFGFTLSALRLKRKLSQERLAPLCGLNHGYISRLEWGSRAPSRAAVEKIAAALQLTPEESDALFVSAGLVPSDLPQAAIVAALTAARRAA